MSRVNWIRLIIGGVIASVILFLTDGFFHERVVAADWAAVFTALGIKPPVETPANLLYFAIYEVGRGFLAMILYGLMRPCCKPGPKTAAIAGVVVWLAFSVTGPAQFIPLGFFSHGLWVKVGGFHLITSIIATIAGAAFYREAKGEN
jgi:hypothetical protein